jgi:hypothetical protein
MRWVMMKNGAELKAHLNELADSAGLSHIVPGHGDVIAADSAARLKQAAARL